MDPDLRRGAIDHGAEAFPRGFGQSSGRVTREMRVFVVVATGDGSKVRTALQEKGYQHFPVKADAWLVAFEGTTRELAENVGIRGGETSPGLVCAISGYSGRLPKEAWEWLGLHHEAANE